MTGSPRERLEEVLMDLRRLKDIRHLAVVRRDGLLIAHDLPDDDVAEKVAAMSAAMVGTGEITSRELTRGDFERALIEAQEGRFLATGAGDQAILVGLLRKECNLGLVLLSLERAAGNLATIITAELVSGPTPEADGRGRGPA